MSKYIEPPKSEDCVWRKGPPPSIGWWPADHELRDPQCIRWWDGVGWSCYALDTETSADAAASVVRAYPFPNKEIRWTDRWWEKK